MRGDRNEPERCKECEKAARREEEEEEQMVVTGDDVRGFFYPRVVFRNSFLFFSFILVFSRQIFTSRNAPSKTYILPTNTIIIFISQLHPKN